MQMHTELEMEVRGAAVGDRDPSGFNPVRVDTTRGAVELRHYPAPDARAAAVLIGGVGGGWDTPARELYPRLGAALPAEGMAVVRVRLRRPTDLAESVLDALAAVAYLTANGIERLGLVGHSFGGAVALQAAAAASPAVRAVVTLATQSFGAEAASELGDACAVLSIHGTHDEVLPPSCSEQVQRLSLGPRRLVLLEGAGHLLDEAADEVQRLVHDWLLGRVARAAEA